MGITENNVREASILEAKKNMTEIFCSMIDSYASMLVSEGPVSYKNVLDSTDRMLWTQIGKDDFNDITMADIHEAVIILVSDIVSSVAEDTKLASDYILADPKEKAKMLIETTVADIAKFIHGLKDAKSRIKNNKDISYSIQCIMASGGRLTTLRMEEDYQEVKDLSNEGMKFFKQLSLAQAALTVSEKFMDSIKSKTEQIETIKRKNRT